MPRIHHFIRRWRAIVSLPMLLVALVVGSVYGWYRYHYPYGVDHCCATQLSLALFEYAQQHDSQFPTGGETPEASLSLLYPKYCDADLLRGKGYPLEPARELLEAGRPLTPETCGWQYVDGLTLQRNLANRVVIAWDKIGSGHNAEILPHGGHSVIFMDGSGRVINEADWPRFLAAQELAWAAIRHGETPSSPWLPNENR